MPDVNGTRHHLLFGQGDWSGAGLEDRLPASGTQFNLRTGELTLEPLPPRMPASPARAPFALRDRRGADADRFGSIYWIDDPATGIRVQGSCDGVPTTLWDGTRDAGGAPPRPGSFGPVTPVAAHPLPLRGLAITSEHLLVAGVGGERPGFITFDLRSGGGPPHRAAWPASVPLVPFDLAATPDGGVAMLDRANKRLWRLDRHLQVIPVAPAVPEPAPAGGFTAVAPATTPPPGPAKPPRREIRHVQATDATTLPGDPISVTALADGDLLVLLRSAPAPSTAVLVRDGVVVGPPRSLHDPEGRPILAHHAVVLPADAKHGRADETLLVLDAIGDRAHEFSIDRTGPLNLTALPRLFPLHRAEGRAAVSAPSGPWYDAGDRFLPLVEFRSRRHVAGAEVVTRPLPGYEPDCIWHRVFVDGCLPTGTSIAVFARAHDDADLVKDETWVEQPPLRRRAGGSWELAWPSPDRDAPDGTWELLLQNVRGQFAQIKLVLHGDGRATPRVRALRVWYPRFSYLHEYLPAAYREDEQSASFLERYLANPEGILTELEGKVAGADLQFDPRSATPQALDWLAGWFGAALDPAWNEDRRRLFLRHAARFYSLRGTILGLQQALALALAPCASDATFDDASDRLTGSFRIVERFRSRRTPGIVLGDTSAASLPQHRAAGPRWRPDDGVDALDARWQAAIGDDAATFPLEPSADAAATWNAFVLRELGFIPSGQTGRPAPWLAFLERRGEPPHDLPSTVPLDADDLRTWFLYESVVVPMRAAAHRFTVLLPVPVPDEQDDEPVEVLEVRHRAIAERILTLQAPAHTRFDIRFYWQAFRVGEARLAVDTAIGRPIVPLSMVLGRQHLGETRLGGDPPPVLSSHRSVGRDPLGDWT